MKKFKEIICTFATIDCSYPNNPDEREFKNVNVLLSLDDVDVKYELRHFGREITDKQSAKEFVNYIGNRIEDYFPMSVGICSYGIPDIKLR